MSATSPDATLRSRRRSLAAVTFGNSLEWYEWAIYSIFAPFIAAVMFEEGDEVSALLKTFAVFAVGFFMRPLGGIVFGRLADRVGRKNVLLATLLLMGAGSLTIGLMPDFDSIGVWAPVVLLAARMVQGLAHGGESATSNSYVAELAPPERRGTWSSVWYMAVLIGTIIAFVLGVGLLALLGETAVADWAWRIPFVLGGGVAIVVLFLRRRMEESEVFTQAKDAVEVPAVPARRMARPLLTAVGLICGLTVFQYTWLSFVPNHAIVSEGMDAQSAYLVMAAAQLIALACLPFWGRLGDRAGRKPVFVAWAIVVAVIQVPLFSMVSDEPWTLFVAATIAWVAATATGALQAAAVAEQFSTRQRTFGIGLALSVSVALFGGTTPYLNAFFESQGLGWLATAYIIGAALVTGLTALLMPERAGVDLSSIDLNSREGAEEPAAPLRHGAATPENARCEGGTV